MILRLLIYILLGALALALTLFFGVPLLVALLLLALGGLLTSNSEDKVGYNFIDWLKDHILALFRGYESFQHAKVARLEGWAEAVKNRVAAEEKKLLAFVRKF